MFKLEWLLYWICVLGTRLLASNHAYRLPGFDEGADNWYWHIGPFYWYSWDDGELQFSWKCGHRTWRHYTLTEPYTIRDGGLEPIYEPIDFGWRLDWADDVPF